jgi:two-component system cell cycle sensor histidine kinase/response regulator CckA
VSSDPPKEPPLAGTRAAPRIRILHLEDNRGDRLLVRSLFEAEGVDCEFVEAETESQFTAALEEKAFDLILSDYALPSFDGISALRLARERRPDIPFLFFSGTMGEELAIETLKAGATDYVLKDRTSRLLPAVRRALEEARDAAERQRAVGALQESEARFEAVLDSALDAVVMMDAEGRITGWNPQAETVFGWARAEALGKPLSDTIIPPRYRQAHVRGLKHFLETGEGPVLHKRLEITAMHRDGREFPVELAISVSESAGTFNFSAFIRDITERKGAEEALQASEERYRFLFENNPQPLWVFDEESLKFLAVNEATCHHYGYSREEFLGMTIRDIRPTEEVPSLLRRIAAEPAEHQESGVLRHRKKDGTLIEAEITSHPLVFGGRRAQLVLALDVTERRQLEAQLRQSQKMEAVGTLAGGVAHDFNNLLTTILGYSGLVLEQLREEDPLREEIREIQRAGERAADLTRQLLAFSRKQVLAPVVLGLNAIVVDMEKMLRRLIGEDVDLTAMLAPDLWSVQADPGQIEQVIVNLIVNARDAMKRGGKVTIETRNINLDDSYLRSHGYVRLGEYVCLSVTDTGTGMDPQTRSRIFEPFFTTKAPGKGTGLGLSTVYGIVKQSGGSIEVYSEPGRGTSFKVYLPRALAAEKPAAPHVRPSPLGGSEIVLLVEDEEAVRRLARLVLEKSGYAVLEAGSAEDAQSIVASHAGAIDLLLTDSVMPGMSGPDLARTLRSERPELRVLFMSGYTDDAIVRHGLLTASEAFLQKPFTPEGLARKVREVLDS